MDDDIIPIEKYRKVKIEGKTEIVKFNQAQGADSSFFGYYGASIIDFKSECILNNIELIHQLHDRKSILYLDQRMDDGDGAAIRLNFEYGEARCYRINPENYTMWPAPDLEADWDTIEVQDKEQETLEYVANYKGHKRFFQRSDRSYYTTLGQSSENENGNSNYCLLAENGCRLTHWEVWYKKAGPVVLERLNRYLFHCSDTNKLAYARLAGTRITKFGDGLILLAVKLYESEVLWQLKIKFDRKGVNVETGNVKFYLSSKDSKESAVLTCWFDGAELTFRKFEEVKSPYIQNLIEQKDLYFLHSNLLGYLLEPFRYEHKLLGEEANKFFSRFRLGTQFLLGLVRIDDNFTVLESSRMKKKS